MSCFVLAAAFYGVFTVNRWTFSIFLFLQASSAVWCPLLLLLPPASPMSCIVLRQAHACVCYGVSLAGIDTKASSDVLPLPMCCRAWCSSRSASTWWTAAACWAAAWTQATPSCPPRRYFSRFFTTSAFAGSPMSGTPRLASAKLCHARGGFGGGVRSQTCRRWMPPECC